MTPDEPVADFEFARYALRSFRLAKDLSSWPGSNAGLYAPSPHTSYAEWVGTGGNPGNWTYRWVAISHSHGEDWRDGTCAAVCHASGKRTAAEMTGIHKDHTAPNEHCTCGIYGSLSYADLISNFRHYANFIVTVIAAEGITIIGDRGLRTQYARVVAYWTAPNSVNWQLDNGSAPRTLSAQQFQGAKRYECPVEMVEAYGLALLPPAKKLGGNGAASWWTAT